MITAELIRDLLDYNTETGQFTWRKVRSNRVKVGAVAGCDAGDEIGRVIRLENYNHRVARLAWLYMTGEWPEQHVYPINGDVRDTRWSNLDQRNRGAHLECHVHRASGIELTHERLKMLVSYDADTGLFTHRAPIGLRAKAGDVAGSVNDRGYVRVCVDGKNYRGHHLAWFYVHGVWPAGKLDHRDRDRSNNRIDNLREATNSQNQANRAKQRNNTSGYKGVYWIESQKKWVARVTFKRKTYHLGSFDSPEQAHVAYRAGAERIHGDFAMAE